MGVEGGVRWGGVWLKVEKGGHILDTKTRRDKKRAEPGTQARVEEENHGAVDRRKWVDGWVDDWLIGWSVWLLLLRGVRLLAARCPVALCVAKSWVGIWLIGLLAGLIHDFIDIPTAWPSRWKKWNYYFIFILYSVFSWYCSCYIVVLWYVKLLI